MASREGCRSWSLVTASISNRIARLTIIVIYNTMKLSAAITLAAVSGAQAFTAPVNKPLRPASSLSVSQSDLDGAQSMIDGILKVRTYW